MRRKRKTLLLVAQCSQKTSTSVVGRPSYSEVASRSSSPKSSSSTLVDKATSSMTDKQVEIFARTLADEASREENK